jgi:hypothetical protein
VPDAGSGGHPLNFVRAQNFFAAGRVFVRQRALDDIGNDFHIGVTVSAEPLVRLDVIFVDHAQGAKTHKFRIVIIIERKRVFRIEPSVISAAAFVGASDFYHFIETPRLKKIVVSNFDKLRINERRAFGIINYHDFFLILSGEALFDLLPWNFDFGILIFDLLPWNFNL